MVPRMAAGSGENRRKALPGRREFGELEAQRAMDATSGS
jgi:hypothetical protein